MQVGDFILKDAPVEEHIQFSQELNAKGFRVEEHEDMFVVVEQTPYVPTVEEKIQALTAAIQSFMDSKVHEERGYDDVFTAISYINSTNRRFATEARAALEWRDAIWTLANSLLAQYKAGAIEEMTAEEVIAKFPPLVWNTEPIG